MARHYSQDIEHILNNIFKNEQEYRKFLEFCARGNLFQLDITSLLKLYNERPDASQMFTYSAWQSFNRNVKKSRHCIRLGNNSFFEDEIVNTSTSSKRCSIKVR